MTHDGRVITSASYADSNHNAFYDLITKLEGNTIDFNWPHRSKVPVNGVPRKRAT